VNASALNYSALREVLDRSGFALALSELHGNICGIICADGARATHRWLDDCIGEYVERDDPRTTDELKRTLHEVASTTSEMLAGDDLEFEPLVPDDESSLEDQVNALALYCHGFLSGFGLSGERSSLDAKLEEILGDFAQITRAGVTEGDHEDRSQAGFALAEIKEYVRVGVQIVFEELGRPRATTH
jgi:uncharacterized protein YgfB (UPF0149 family)